MTSESLKTGRRGQAGARPKPPDDPSIRVVLAEGFRRELDQERRTRVAKKVLSPGRSVLHPSSVSRYVAAKVFPTLIVAKRLAAAAGRPLAEAVAGYSARHGRPTQTWTKQLLYARAFRGRVFEFLDQFANVLGYVHFGFPTDPKRGYRRAVRPLHERPEYGYFEVVLEEPRASSEPIELILSYLLFEHPPVFIDYGRITLAKPMSRPPYQGGLQGVATRPFDLPLLPSLARKGNVTPSSSAHPEPVEGCVSRSSTDSTVEISGFELWTRRCHTERVSGETARIWVQTWLDGKATDFVVRSDRPFALGAMVTTEELPVGPLTIIPFHPGGMHRHAPAGT